MASFAANDAIDCHQHLVSVLHDHAFSHDINFILPINPALNRPLYPRIRKNPTNSSFNKRRCSQLHVRQQSTLEKVPTAVSFISNTSDCYGSLALGRSSPFLGCRRSPCAPTSNSSRLQRFKESSFNLWPLTFAKCSHNLQCCLFITVSSIDRLLPMSYCRTYWSFFV